MPQGSGRVRKVKGLSCGLPAPEMPPPRAWPLGSSGPSARLASPVQSQVPDTSPRDSVGPPSGSWAPPPRLTASPHLGSDWGLLERRDGRGQRGEEGRNDGMAAGCTQRVDLRGSGRLALPALWGHAPHPIPLGRGMSRPPRRPSTRLLATAESWGAEERLPGSCNSLLSP